MSYRVVVCASGGGSNLQALLDGMRNTRQYEVVAVVSNRGDAGALDRAREARIGAEVIADPSSAAEWHRILDRWRPDLVVLAGYLKLVPREVVDRYRGRMVNIHPSLLPAHGGTGMYGRRVHESVLRSGDAESGATVHLVDESFDRGTILAQQVVPVRPDDTAESLAARVLAVEHALLPAVVAEAARRGRPVPLVAPTADHS